jgi:NAD(P)-dependent dehydrogenase (short-subunit alcohol dehydrogenase family)
MHIKELFDLSGRVAIITGASVGLGRQMAEGLFEAGAKLSLCARNKERCDATAAELQKSGADVISLGCDVKKPEEIQRVVDETVQRFGRIDILINNAGTSWATPVEDMTLEQWNKVMDTNMTGAFLFSQAVGKVLVAQKRGKIVNIASVAGLRGSPPDFQAIGYQASKGALITFTKDLACKWAMHNINVNAIAPGWFPTHMSGGFIVKHEEDLKKRIPLHRFGSDQDLKGAALFLASDASNFVTGHTLVVDGGQTAW